MAVARRRQEEYLKLGSRTPRTDAAAFVSGRARYATDVVLPGMLHCRLLYSPHAHARIVEIDTSDALSLIHI